MAEVAIPMAALGLMYILSNQKEDPQPMVEGFGENTLPNTKKPPVNYPIENLKDLKTNISKYNGKKTGVENFYKGNNYTEARKRSSNNTGFKSLNGEIMSTGDLEHNNMVPFFGSNVSQPSLDRGNSRLNLYTGSGEEQIKKREQGSLFKPQKNMSHVFGAPNVNNFVQERMQLNISDKQNNVKPWKEIRVGPGLNKGYSSEGSGGFNSSMQAREKMLPKTVDQLRTETNPKISYGTQTLGAYAGKGYTHATTQKHQGKIEKNRPDTYFINTPDRWLTTTGASGEAQKNRATVMLKATNNIQSEHFGNSNRNKNGIYQQGHYNETHKQKLDGPVKHLGTASASGKKIDGGSKDTYDNLVNNRALTSDQKQWGSAYGGFMNAVMAPVLDIIRPTRKENVIGNMRPVGNMNNGAWGVKNGRVWSPNDAPQTTIKEQLIDNDRIAMANALEGAGGYTTNPKQLTYQQRDTTNCMYIPNGGVQTQVKSYDAAYNAELNPNKQELLKQNFHNHGNEKLFNSNINVTNLRNRATKAAQTYPNMPKQAPSQNTFGQMGGKHTREVSIGCSRNNNGMVQAFKENPYTHSLHTAV
jgi:hypothetical protein